MEKKVTLEDRLVEHAIVIVRLTQSMPFSPAGKYYSDQLLRSAGSAALNYGEAQAGESHRDFTHKLKMVKKEMRESFLCLRIIKGAALHPDRELIENALGETDQLVAIFTKAVKTAEASSPRKQ